MAQIVISSLPPLPNETGSGVPLGSDITPATDITDFTEATTGTTKKYTRSAELNFVLASMGLTTYSAVTASSTGPLGATYSNGLLGVGATLVNSGAQAALALDGVTTLAVGSRVLISDQTTTYQNGIYVVTNLGSISSNWVLTRATDYNTPSQIIQYGLVLINLGATLGGQLWQETGAGPFTIGVTPILFAKYVSTSVSGGAVLLNPTAPQTIATYGLTVPSLTTANMSFDVTANTIKSTNTDGNINITPNGSGIVSLGSLSPVDTSGQVQILGAPASMTVGSFFNSSGVQANYLFYKSRSVTTASHTTVLSGDALGNIVWNSDDGSTYKTSGSITMNATGTVGSGFVPGLMRFYTAASSGTNTLALSIDSTQTVTLANPLPAGSGGTGSTTATGTGSVVLQTSPTITTPIIAQINNASAQAMLQINSAGSSTANFFALNSSTSGSPITLSALGSDANITMQLAAKGTGQLLLASQNLTTPVVIFSGTSSQHQSNFVFANTAATDSYTFPDVSGTMTVLGNASTGSGSVVLQTSPTLTTPNIGAATGTSLVTSGNIQSIGGGLVAGTPGTAGIVVSYPGTTNSGALILQAVNSSGNFNGFINNASLSGARSWIFPDASGTVLLSGQAISTVPSITFSSTSGIIGTTTNDSAAAGSVGEVKSNVIAASSSVSITTGTVTTIASVSLTAGDWDIWGNITFLPNQGVTVATAYIGWISTNPAGLPDASLYNYIPSSGIQNSNPGLTAPGFTISLSAPATYYLSCFTAFSVSTLTGCGGVYARRRR